MANINSYPKATAKANDLVLGTSVPADNTNEQPKTRNFSVSEIAGLGPSSVAGAKAYIASFDQTSTDAPVVTEIYNNTGATFTWTRTNTGRYSVTASSAVLTENKTFYNIQGSGKSAAQQIIQPTSLSTTVATYRQVSGNNYSDGNRGWLELRIYN